MFRSLSAAAVFLLLGGCDSLSEDVDAKTSSTSKANEPSASKDPALDYPPVPLFPSSTSARFPEMDTTARENEIRRLGEEAVKSHLRNPASAQFRGQFTGKRNVACGEVTSEGLGGYTGFGRYIAVNSSVVVLEPDMRFASEFSEAWTKFCN